MTINKFYKLLVLFNLCFFPWLANADSEKVFELRTYTTHAGKLEALHQRFANHTTKLFEKHGMKNIGYWVPKDESNSRNTLIYIISHKSREAAEKSWEAFMQDPNWQKAYKDSHKEGKIVAKIESVFMSATTYSLLQ